MEFDCPAAEALAQDHLWWEIYRDSFPANQREPAEVILDSLRKQVGLAFRVRVNGATAGLATTHLLREPPAVFLVYLAMDRGRRSAGLGGALLEYAWARSAARLRQRGLEAIGLIWEVDAPHPGGEAAETSLRERRIAFFRRHGGAVLERPYLQPPLDGITPVPMQLMFRPAENTGALDAAAVKALVYAIYFEKYRAINQIPQATLQRLLL